MDEVTLAAFVRLTAAVEELALEWINNHGEKSVNDDYQDEAYDALMEARAVLGRTNPIGSS